MDNLDKVQFFCELRDFEKTFGKSSETWEALGVVLVDKNRHLSHRNCFMRFWDSLAQTSAKLASHTVEEFLQEHNWVRVWINWVKIWFCLVPPAGSKFSFLVKIQRNVRNTEVHFRWKCDFWSNIFGAILIFDNLMTASVSRL